MIGLIKNIFYRITCTNMLLVFKLAKQISNWIHAGMCWGGGISEVNSVSCNAGRIWQKKRKYRKLQKDSNKVLIWLS